ncbi:hypothetical protein L2E82_09118 [Cichorium intybus]|uniref:Uncharacterized protein n=1 Tax=Cichorium intybus TaxID=13427 RepID=A0ACB9G8J8_CICIN|nr:hypothetical protein L2E82_09118 [Cichorium intybus]
MYFRYLPPGLSPTPYSNPYFKFRTIISWAFNTEDHPMGIVLRLKTKPSINGNEGSFEQVLLKSYHTEVLQSQTPTDGRALRSGSEVRRKPLRVQNWKIGKLPLISEALTATNIDDAAVQHHPHRPIRCL